MGRCRTRARFSRKCFLTRIFILCSTIPPRSAVWWTSRKNQFLDRPFVRKNHRWFIPLMPLASESLVIPDKYDLVISDTAGFAKGMRVPAGIKHLSYCHTPLRYAWEPEYINSKSKIQN